MTLRRFVRHGGIWNLVIVLLLTATLPAGAEPPRDAPSLALIPADAAYYSAWLRLGEQWEMVRQSKAWAKLVELPLVKESWRQMQKPLLEAGGLPPPVLQAWEDPANQELLRLMGDLAAKEVFVYAGAGASEFTDLMGEFIAGVQGARVVTIFGMDQQKAQVHALLTALNEAKDLRFPDTLLGLRTTQGPAAANQVKRLEEQLTGLIKGVPALAKALKRTKIAGADFLVLQLDGKMVPWDQFPIKDFEEDPDEFKELPKKLAKLQLTIGLGLKGDYVYLALGKELGFLEKLAEGPRLMDRPELKYLAAHKDRPLLGVTYTSAAFAEGSDSTVRDFNDLVNTILELFEDFDLSEKDQERLEKDLKKFTAELAARMPKPGAKLTFTYRSERGMTQYAYDWGKNHGMDATKPLSLLNHLGGTPIFATLGRSQGDADRYDFIARWSQVAFRYFEELGVPELTDDQKDLYKQAKEKFIPLIVRFDTITRTLWLPATKEGQGAFVLDAKLSSRQWQPLMPESEQPLPILEPALVMGITDAEKIRKAAVQYRDLANEFIKAAGELGGFPVEPTVPEPQTQSIGIGTIYYYPLPEEAALDSRLSPSAGLSDKVLAFTISREHAVRLLTPAPLTFKEGNFVEAGKRPLAAVTLLDWATLMDALQPWVAYGLKQAHDLLPADDNPATKDLAGQVKTLLNVLKCMRGFVTLTTIEGDVMVSRSETIFRDLDN